MSDLRSKRAILATLSYQPDYSELKTLPALGSREGRHLLQWLDQSGLALPFLRRLQIAKITPNISLEWRDALEQRWADNVERTQDMLEEARRINSALRMHGVTPAVVKGFTLVPDFCEEAAFRHQVDLDFLVAREEVRQAAEALESCGYSCSQLNEAGESYFTTPLRHVPTAADYMYALPRHRQVDLHISIWEECSWLPIEVPHNCLERAEVRSLYGAEFLTLSLEDKFLLQLLHAFRHSFRSWIRVSWLLEIARCMENHQEDAGFWNRVIERAGSAKLTKSIFGFILGLITRLFQTPISSPLRLWATETISLTLRTWLDSFAVEWVISDWPGNLNNLFLTAEFIPDRKLKMDYWRSRVLPRKVHASVGAVASNSAKIFFKLQIEQFRYVAHRTAVHLEDLVRLPLHHMRWRRALEASRRTLS